MSYIGNQVTSSPFVVDQYSGNGATTQFLNLSYAPAATSSIAVFVDGRYQTPTANYTTNGTTLNFTASAVPPTGTNNIQVLHLGIGSTAVAVVADGSVTTAKLAANIDLGSGSVPHPFLLSGM